MIPKHISSLQNGLFEREIEREKERRREREIDREREREREGVFGTLLRYRSDEVSYHTETYVIAAK